MGGGGGINMPALHSSVDLSHKYIYNMLLLIKEGHSLLFLSYMIGLWYYTLAFVLNLEW